MSIDETWQSSQNYDEDSITMNNHKITMYTLQQ